jgi:hypothetical protein
MKKILNTIFAVLAGAAVVACNLDVLPTSAIAITEGEALIQTEENLEQFTLNLHGYYRACHQGEYYIAEEVMLDNFNATSGYGNNYGTMHKCDGGLTANDYYIDPKDGIRKFRVPETPFVVKVNDPNIDWVF